MGFRGIVGVGVGVGGGGGVGVAAGVGVGVGIGVGGGWNFGGSQAPSNRKSQGKNWRIVTRK